MPIFSYKGKTLSGEVRRGEIESSNLAMATSALRRQQIIPASISEKKKGLGSIEIKIPGLGRKVTTKEVVIFTRMFATMIDAGLPLIQCLDILHNQQENPVFKKALSEVKSSVEGGATFADALKKQPKVFDELYVNLVAAGEVGGILDVILNRLASFMEKSEKIKSNIKSAMTYPGVVIGIALIIVTGLLVFVVPIFEDMFADFGKALPLPTQIVVNMSNAIKGYWYAIVAPLVVIVLGLRKYYGTNNGRMVIDGILLKVPVLGDLLRKTAVARFTRTLGTMISSGVPILDALDIVSKTAGNRVVEDAVMKARTALSQGKTFSEPLAETKIFPGMVTQMISVGESSGSLDSMLNKIADFYEEEVDAAVASLTSLIEPMLMVFLGVVVGGLVIALYLPIFQLAGASG
ncbi:MAG: type II secretion system F family protein [Deltaproteobacteria bacterium]|nr:type II secretion system F family protein [Deltaproteobacteria bacterium]